MKKIGGNKLKQIHGSNMFSLLPMLAPGEVVKLQNHLRLLREEYVKLQKRLAETERKYQVLSASAGQTGDNNFVTKLLNTVAELFDKELYRFVHPNFLLKNSNFLDNMSYLPVPSMSLFVLAPMKICETTLTKPFI